MVTDAPCSRWVLRWVWCRIVFPEPQLDTIAIFNGMFSILLSLPSSLKTPYSLRGVTALSCQNSPFFQDGSQPWRRRLLQQQPIPSHRMRGCYIVWFSMWWILSSKMLLRKLGVIGQSLVLWSILLNITWAKQSHNLFQKHITIVIMLTESLSVKFKVHNSLLTQFSCICDYSKYFWNFSPCRITSFCSVCNRYTSNPGSERTH